MKRRWLSCLLAACLLTLAVMPVSAHAEELDFPEIELELGTKEETRGEGDDLDKVNNENTGLLESLGKKDWNAAANKVVKTGDWREDLVAVAESQIGYQQDSAGLTIYDVRPVEEQTEPVEWTALFINWVAEKAGLSKKEFPRGEDYKALRKAMDKVHALKQISRANYPVSGDVAFIEKDGQQLVGVITYVANGYATIIHGDDNGRVTRNTYLVDTKEFKYYADVNVLMERVGIEIGKGGDVPEIPEGGVAAWTNTKAVYLRSEPTTACKSLTTVKKSGTAVLVTSAAMQEDGYIWYGVTYNGHEGYIRGDLLKLDMSAIPTGTPAATQPPVPESTPAPEVIPGCKVCVAAAKGVALPVDCCYAHLASMDRGEQVRFMNSLRGGDSATFRLYVAAHAAHVAAGEAALICLGDVCGESAWTAPNATHAADCPWYVTGGLTQQERVVNVEVREAIEGQEITILFEIYGALAYQWHEVTTVTNADGTVAETDTAIEGATAESITVVAKGEGNTSYSYYCVATILANGVETQVASKVTVLSVGAAPIIAQAVLGEEINFTYENAQAAAYQWYVQADENAAPVAIPATDAAYTGVDSAKLTFHATAENSGALYSCAALDAEGTIVGMSGYYAYAIAAYVETPDASICEGHDLCRYVEELAILSREERFTVLNTTWNVSATDLTSETAAQDNLAELVVSHWIACHQETYPNLLCTCASTQAGGLVLHPHNDVHEANCPWYATPVQTESGVKTSQRADQAEFDLWAVTATAEMIARAKTVPTLDHAVMEKRSDNTYDLYIARYADPVGTVDAQGYLSYGAPARVIAWVDFATGTLYAMDNLPDHAPAN